jgi:zinc transport system permease protein
MLELFSNQSFLCVILAGISCSLLGVFVLWKKISYFGDALSHAILLGLVLGLIWQYDQILMLLGFAIIFSLLVVTASKSSIFAKDSIVMIISYLCIALATIFGDLYLDHADFHDYIFGNPGLVGLQDLIFLSVVAVVVIFYVFYSFKKILLINLNKDLARTEGINVELNQLIFLIILSLVIALSVKIIGIFLMTALMVLPAAIARIFSNSPLQMLIQSLFSGILVSGFSFKIASENGLNIGSTIVVIFSLIFFVSLIAKRRQ